MEKPVQVLSLCPSCSACPSVEVFAEGVRIGEGENVVRLSKLEWNRLVEAIRTGRFAAIL